MYWHIYVDKWYTLQAYLGRWTRPDTYICSASAQKAELNAVGVLEVSTWGGAGVSVLVCTRGAAFEMDWWKFGGVSVDTTIYHTCLSAPVCTACIDMVYSTELKRNGTTTAILRLKTLAFIFHRHDQFDFLRPKDELGLSCTCHV